MSFDLITNSSLDTRARLSASNFEAANIGGKILLPPQIAPLFVIFIALFLPPISYIQ